LRGSLAGSSTSPATAPTHHHARRRDEGAADRARHPGGEDSRSAKTGRQPRHYSAAVSERSLTVYYSGNLASFMTQTLSWTPCSISAMTSVSGSCSREAAHAAPVRSVCRERGSTTLVRTLLRPRRSRHSTCAGSHRAGDAASGEPWIGCAQQDLRYYGSRPPILSSDQSRLRPPASSKNTIAAGRSSRAMLEVW